MANFFDNQPLDGLVGLAFQSIAVDNVVPPVINAINQGILDAPVFTIWMEDRGDSNNVQGGVFTYGGIDTQHCGKDLTYVPLSSASYWQFSISGVTVGSVSVKRNWEIISDSGTSLINAPDEVVDQIAVELNAQFDELGYLYVQCSGNPDIIFTIGDNRYAIKERHYLINRSDPNLCLVALEKAGTPNGFDSPEWILGDPWIRQFCNVYDVGQKRIGFATAHP
ncbi:hypothetical protein L596_022277 [Steinernema carpocapsae]|uniref:Peptidase A1 domain-containing protein n=1 Tax=Steinernema carpocapsae TaxID=34508 RepID=A0A4U5MLB3_STECR|nr:hypothetical protein L596_022277 [Steinernema carpocapsae]